MNELISYHREGITRVIDIAHVDNTNIIMPTMPQISEHEGKIRLKFSEIETATTSSLLRSRQGYVDYTVRDLASIPHDFVHAALSPIPQGRVIGGQTPDIVWDEEDGSTSMIEVATRNVHVFERARGALTEKINKYYHHFQEGRVQHMNVVVVYMQGVITIGDVLTQQSVEILVNAYHMGLEILEEIKRTTTIQVSPELEKISKEYLWFKGVKFQDIDTYGRAGRVILNQSERDRIRDCPTDFKLHYVDGALREPCRGALTEWLHQLPGDIYDSDTVVHLPLIQDSSHEELELVGEAQGYGNLVHLYMEGFPEVQNLKFWRTIDLETRKKIRKQELRRECKVLLNEEDRIHLAKRGVLKKSIMHMQIVQDNDDKQSRSYSGRADLSDIRMFMNEPLKYTENEFINPYDLEEFNITDNTNFDPHQIISTLLNTDLFRAISLLDLIVREVILSMRSNPEDDEKHNRFAFISKRIGPYNVVIRTTKYSGVSDSPTFFMILSTHPFKPLSGIFEDVYQTRAIYHTKFVSLSRLRAEHLCNILPQCLSLYMMTYDELGPGLTNADMTLDSLNVVSKQAKSIITTLLEDKEYTSRNLQQMRYYYMELIASGKDFAEKIASKLDNICRSRLFLYFVNELLFDGGEMDTTSIQIAQSEEKAEESRPTTWSGSDDAENQEQENEDQAFLSGLRSNEPHVNIRSYLGSNHTSLQSLLIPMYLSVLHNKNEQEKTLSAKQIMNKILKEEYLLDRSMYCSGDDSYDPNLKLYEHHDWSLRVVKRSAHLLRAELEKLTHSSLHTYAMHKMSSTTMDELATTKASHSGICQTRLRSKDDIDLIGNRDKCFIQLLKRGAMPSAYLIENVELLRDAMIKENDCRVLVQMFKKNQIGGTREILILDFVSRCLIRILEDLSRALCEAHPYECLTKPHLKGHMVANHSYKVKQAGFTGRTLTWRASLDKTTWAQMFVNPIFYTILSEIVPDYADFIAFVLNCHSRKRMELPIDLVKSFYDAKKSNLRNYEVNKLREEFLGFSDPSVLDSPYTPYINNASNMMQGILHYTSSLVHVAYCVQLKTMFEKIVRTTGNSMIYSAQVSSDDSGLIVTVLVRDKDADLVRLSQMLDLGFQRAILTLDLAFGVRTSMQKSTMTFRPLYEFNSAFYSGNNFTCPLIKYVARSCDDSPSESLRSRVINMHNSLREVRANGGSGALCAVISVCQKLTVFMNLGYASMSFYEEYIQPLRTYKLSHLGVYISLPPLIAGIYGADYSDFHHCMVDPSCHALLSVLHRRPVIGGKLLSDLSAHYRAWPVKKYKQVMSDLDIEVGFGHKLSFKELEFMFRPSISWKDIDDKVRLSVSNQTIARSFTFLTRCESIFSSAYMLWDKIYHTGDSESFALDEFIERAVEISRNDTEMNSLDRIFPNHVDLLSVHLSLECQVQIDVMRTRFIYRPHYYEPIHSGLHDMSLIKDILAKKWYGMIVRPSTTTIDLSFNSLVSMLPWLDEDPEVTLRNSGMSSPLELINYITMLSERVHPISLVSMGGTRRNRGIIENVSLLNTFRNRICFLRQPEEYQFNKEELVTIRTGSRLIRQFQNRIADWQQLINHFHGDWETVDKLAAACSDDLYGLSRKHEADLRISLDNSSERRTAAEVLSILDGSVWSTYITNNNDRSLESHIGELKYDQLNRQKGSCVIIKKQGYQKYMFRSDDGRVRYIHSNTSEMDLESLQRNYPSLDFSTANRGYNIDIFYQIPNEIRYYKSKLWLCYTRSNKVHYLCELFQIYGTMLEPLSREFIKRNPLAVLWLSRSIDTLLIERLMEADPVLTDQIKHLALNSQKLVSSAKVRAQFERSRLIQEQKDEEEKDIDYTARFEEMMKDYVLTETDRHEDEQVYIPQGYIETEYVFSDSDLYSAQFRSEPDIGYLTIHPLMTEIIRMINFRLFTLRGIGRVALDVALDTGIIGRDEYDQKVRPLDFDEIISKLLG